MDENINQPLFSPRTPASGWWKAPATLATDPVFLRVEDSLRLEAVAAYVSAIGWALTHNAEDGWMPAAALLYGQACPAPPERLKAAAGALVSAGIFTLCNVDGISGYVIAGAAKAVKERFARKDAASAAGKVSAEVQSRTAKEPRQKPGKIDANMPVNWSNVSEQL